MWMGWGFKVLRCWRVCYILVGCLSFIVSSPEPVWVGQVINLNNNNISQQKPVKPCFYPVFGAYWSPQETSSLQLTLWSLVHINLPRLGDVYTNRKIFKSAQQQIHATEDICSTRMLIIFKKNIARIVLQTLAHNWPNWGWKSKVFPRGNIYLELTRTLFLLRIITNKAEDWSV